MQLDDSNIYSYFKNLNFWDVTVIISSNYTLFILIRENNLHNKSIFHLVSVL